MLRIHHCGRGKNFSRKLVKRRKWVERQQNRGLEKGDPVGVETPSRVHALPGRKLFIRIDDVNLCEAPSCSGRLERAKNVTQSAGQRKRARTTWWQADFRCRHRRKGKEGVVAASFRHTVARLEQSRELPERLRSRPRLARDADGAIVAAWHFPSLGLLPFPQPGPAK